MAIRKVKAGLVKTEVDDFVGEEGNLFFDTSDGVLRLSDGETPGGIVVGGGGGGGLSNSFTRIAVAGQSNIVADNSNDLLTIVAGTGITITTNATTDTLTLSTSITDTNTTYGLTAETVSGTSRLKLTGSDSSTNFVGLTTVKNIDLSIADGTVSFSVPDRTVTMYQEGDLEIITGTSRWYSPFSITVNKITARLDTAANANVTVLVKKNGTTVSTLVILANQLKILENVDLSMATDDYLTIDVTSIGTGETLGAGLSVEFTYSIT